MRRAVDEGTSRVDVGQRWVIRYRLPDGSATDAIGWLTSIDDQSLVLEQAAGEPPVTIDRGLVVVARRAPAAAGGPDPSRTSAEHLEQLAALSWVADHQPFGEWTLRAGGGFTGRANSCLAVGDPGVPLATATTIIEDYARVHEIPPWVQVIVGSDVEQGLLELGWRPVYVQTDVLAVRLADLLGTSLPDPSVEVSEDVSAFWSAYAQSRPYEADPAIVRRIVDGVPPRAFGTVSVDGEVIAIGRAALSSGWLGLSSIWTRPDHRRRGWATKIMLSLGHWAARRGARWAYLQVASENAAAIAAYERLGFRRHHRYRYLEAERTGARLAQ